MQNILMVGTAVTRPGAVGTLFRAENDGAWAPVEGIPADAAVQAITPHPDDASLVYVAARKGLYRSRDAGKTWHRLPVPDDIQFWSVHVHPNRPGTLFAGTAPVGVYRSDDYGDTWRACQTGYPERFNIKFGASRMMRLAFHPENPDIMYGASEINGFFVSEDGGETWRREDAGLAALAEQPQLKSKIETDDEAEGMYDAHAVYTTPAAPDSAFYVCRMGIFETRDLGKTWRDLEAGKYAPFVYSRDGRVVKGDPRKIYACFSISSRSEAGAIYASNDAGASWTHASEPVTAHSTVMGLALHLNDPDGVIGVTRGGQVLYTTDGSRTWADKPLPADAGDAFCAAML